MQNALYRRLAHVMEWGVVSRGCLPAGFVLFLYSMHLVWALVMLRIPGGTAVINRDCFAVQFWVILAIMGGAIALLALGLLLRRTAPEARWYPYLTANYYGLTLAWGGYLTGTLNMATGVVLMGAPIVGFLLLERRVVLVALATAFAAILLFNLASAWHYLPYAPLLLTPHDRASALLWTLSQLLLAGPHIISCVTQVGLVLGQWREREAAALTLSLTDALTAAHNRRSILEVLGRELARARRQEHALAVVLLDLDHFKHVNDRWGHPTGDRVLRESARHISAAIRPGDALGRFGGEEFILVLPATGRDQAMTLVERCRQRLADMAVQSDQGEAVPVRASFGLAWVEAGASTSVDALIRSADEALYAAKAGGRDRLMTAPGPCTEESPTGLGQHGDPQHHRRTIRWRELRDTALWPRVLASILEWSPVAKASLVMGLALFMALNNWGWLLYGNHYGQVDSRTAHILLHLMPPISLFCTAAMLLGLLLKRRHPDSRLYLRVALHFFGQTLVALGYSYGMLYMPTGVLMICSPLLGFILFEQSLVLEIFAASLGMTVVLAFCCAMGWIPYAPLMSVRETAWQMATPFWVISNYFFTIWAMLIVLGLTDRVLGRWREREQEIRLLSQTDALTQVGNRRHIMAQLEKHLLQSQRTGAALAVVLLDLDHFKRINDRWGHPTGDRVLQTAARVLKNSLRQDDEIGRYGGEEFMLLLRDTSGAGAAPLVERCRAALAASTVQADNGDEVTISGSFGVASLGAGERCSLEEIVKAADHALYRAKAGGRNRVERAETLLPHYST